MSGAQPAMTDEKATEHLLAVVTLWGGFGAFSFALVLSGFHDSDVVMGLLGFAAVIAGFVGHVIVNSVYGRAFSQLQVAFGMGTFCVAVLCFMAAWLATPGFGVAGIAIGLGGFAAMVAAFLIYLVSKHGMRGAFSMFHRKRRR